MRAQKLNFHPLSENQNFQLEQALAIEAGCNMSEVRFSYSENYIYIWFLVGSVSQCAIIEPDGEYYSFRESISKSVEEAKSLAA